MSANDQIILQAILEQRKAEEAVETSESKYFEYFVVEQVLKDLEPSVDEIASGIVGDGGDGGIDGIYAFVNGELIVDDTDFSSYKRNVHLDLYIIQTKTSKSFGENAIHKFTATSKSILNLANPLEDFTSIYDAELLRVVGNFRRAMKVLAGRFPRLTINYVYATQGVAQDVHPNVEHKVRELETEIKELFSDAEFRFSFIGARELLESSRVAPTMSIELQLQENAISTTDGGYLCLVALTDYYKFISKDGQLRPHIFDANVRDYQPDVEVNEAIRKTLLQNTTQEFWWLNNGITVIASKGTIAGKILTLEDPQIVNGLQTSLEIYNYFAQNPRVKENRATIVKVIITDDSVSRDEVIKATNSQTFIPPTSLTANQKIQRDIEDFFLTKGLYYDRRKNFYKNQHKPRNRIISIQYLAQAAAAIMLRKPDDAKARPTTLLKREGGYESIFNASYPIQLYLNCVNFMRVIETYVRASDVDLPPVEKNSLRYHVAMYATLMQLRHADYVPKDVLGIKIDSLTPEFVHACLEEVLTVIKAMQEETGYPTDRIVKSADSVERLLAHFVKSQGSLSMVADRN